MHLRRPKASASVRHSVSAEEAMQQLIRDTGYDRLLENVLVSFQMKLCGSDDYNFLLRELGN
ncbi:hypothetical protein HanRHA438_Chr01g0003101 [Helianthus annuus]|nr:hypothetical protein HanRHA438_Chr01g0003101 [Helianthus annuus]KAJ0955430.1 hypothetical protein HanPSC8_Chr01g0002781 [Helianthus annuus]